MPRRYKPENNLLMPRAPIMQQDATRVAKSTYHEGVKPQINAFDPNHKYTKPNPNGSNAVIDSYDFDDDKWYMLAPGQGISGKYRVKGSSRLIDKNKLEVSVSTRNKPDYEMSGSVKVKQNGEVYSSDNFHLNPSGYIKETHGLKPLGEARVNLPDTGKYDVDVFVSGKYNDGTGRSVSNLETKLPYSK